MRGQMPPATARSLMYDIQGRQSAGFLRARVELSETSVLAVILPVVRSSDNRSGQGDGLFLGLVRVVGVFLLLNTMGSVRTEVTMMVAGRAMSLTNQKQWEKKKRPSLQAGLIAINRGFTLWASQDWKRSIVFVYSVLRS